MVPILIPPCVLSYYLHKIHTLLPIRIPSEVYLTVPDIYILREVTSLPSSAPAGGLTLAPVPWEPGLGQWRSRAKMISPLLALIVLLAGVECGDQNIN